VPKHEIIHPAGHPLGDEFKEVLLKYFADADLQKLERLGGRILVSISAPYVGRRKRSRQAVAIDERFVREMEAVKNSSDKIYGMLSSLTRKELRKLGGLVGQPIRSKANVSEIRSELVRHFQAEDFWHRISGTTSQEPEDRNP